MSLIIPANSASAAGGYAVDNSCRFNDGSSDNLSRTTETPTNADKYTFSVWVKRSTIGVANAKIFGVQGASANDQNMMEFNADYLWWAQSTSSGQAYRLKSNRVFRDPSAWYHIVVAYDSSQGTANNRIRMYINGVEETSFSTRTNPSTNLDSLINSSVSANAGRTLRLGRTGDNGSQYFDGYMSEVCFIDGLQLAPTSFGEFDEDSGIWKPIDVSGLTFGNNGFYLDFENSGALGADVSGNSNNFTVNNLTAIDQSTDTCTNNFATLNPIAFLNAGGSLSEGNLRFDGVSSSAHNLGVGTIAVNKGKWWFEAEIDAYGGNNPSIGIASYDVNLTLSNYVGGITGTIGYTGNGNINENGSNLATGLNSYTDGDIINIGLDLDNNKIYVYKNGSLENSGGTTITNRLYTFAVSQNHTTGHWLTNFGNPTYTGTDQADGNSRGSFENAPPSGYFALCSKNLAEYG